MPKIAIVSHMTQEERNSIREICKDDVDFIESSEDRDVLAREGEEVEIVYGNVRDFELPKLPQLHWVQCTWAGVENILYPAMIERAPLISNVRGQRARAMSEHAVAGLFYLLRDFPQQQLNKQNCEWSNNIQAGMTDGSNILILGMGAIANELAPRLKALGAAVYGVNSDGRDQQDCAQCFTLNTMHSVLPEIDHVICCLPATATTNKILSTEFFAAIKENAAFVNISRGSVVDHQAMIEAVDSGNLSGAVLDVIDPEPPGADNVLWQHPRILLTGHSSWAPEGDSERAAFPIFCANLKGF